MSGNVVLNHSSDLKLISDDVNIHPSLLNGLSSI